MNKKIGIKQLSGVPGGEGDYIGCVSIIIQGVVVEYAKEYKITHLHYCSSIDWAKSDCFSDMNKDGYEFDSSFFDERVWGGLVLEGCHYESIDRLKSILLDNA